MEWEKQIELIRGFQLKFEVASGSNQLPMRSPVYDFQAAQIYKQTKRLILLIRQSKCRGISLGEAYSKLQLHIEQLEYIVQTLIESNYISYSNQKLFWNEACFITISSRSLQQSINVCKHFEEEMGQNVYSTALLDWFYRNYDELWGNIGLLLRKIRKFVTGKSTGSTQNKMKQNGVLIISGVADRAQIQQGKQGEITIKIKPNTVDSRLVIDFCDSQSTKRLFDTKLC